MMIPTDEHIFQGVKSPTTKPLVICLMEFLSTGMVELGIVWVSAITMNHNDGSWIYYDYFDFSFTMIYYESQLFTMITMIYYNYYDYYNNRVAERGCFLPYHWREKPGGHGIPGEDT